MPNSNHPHHLLNPNQSHSPLSLQPWQVLIVDDDEEVHFITELVLKDLYFEERAIEVLHAYNLDQATTLLQHNPDIGVILLEAVMNHENCGLKLINIIRNELKNQALRIILRTGYPQEIPEQETMIQYDINGYKSKQELTAQKLITTVIASLRAFKTIHALETTRLGMEMILDSSESLFEFQSTQKFASGVLTLLSAFLRASPDGILCVQTDTLNPTPPPDKNFREMHIIGATGDLQLTEGTIDQHTGALSALELAREVFKHKHSILKDDTLALFLNAPNVPDAVAVLQGVQEINDEDRVLLRYFSTKISLALANVIHFKKFKEARKAAAIDFLTKLPNRREFLTIGEQLIRLCKNSNQSITLAMIDIDHFKEINDLYGHEAGDLALKAFSQFMSDHIREEDFFARIGGEEFCLILPRTDQQKSKTILQRICRSLAEHIFEINELQIKLTISVGADFMADDLNHMMSRADRRLYRAKNSGRNRLFMTDERGDENFCEEA
ncbi:diguanylate cyclase [Thiomicrorhabdus xiamenensis]|uniref:diguanylate cyclase n=1 Tax=Thiomicrorhabdus xiamenensis TaxID=2739063 RepID=A0A7D4P5T8_9GAMM|nr:diguanylate cyclase [Thiomicrorhabdus xiamenensis]QKI90116.1 diguanylate cyclase [Thiomicrorhabdus xiamenensis]